MGTSFSTLKYLESLERAGVDRNHAKVQAEGLERAIDSLKQELATKEDLSLAIKDLNLAIKDLEMRMTLKFGAMLSLGVAILAAIIKLQ